MIRRLLAALIALVGTAAILLVVLSTFFPEEDRATIVPPGPVRSVEVDLEAGRVALVAGATDGATLDRTRRYLRGEPVTTETLVDGVLRIKADCRRVLTLGCEVDYRIEVPSSVSVRIRTRRASVSVEDIGGTVEVATGAGGVRLTRTQGPARVTTSAGNIVGEELGAEFLDAATDGGRIRLSLAKPPGRLGLRTDAGSIDVALPPADGGYRVDATADAGKVDVTVAQDPGGSRTIAVRTGAGNIRVHPR